MKHCVRRCSSADGQKLITAGDYAISLSARWPQRVSCARNRSAACRRSALIDVARPLIDPAWDRGPRLIFVLLPRLVMAITSWIYGVSLLPRVPRPPRAMDRCWRDSDGRALQVLNPARGEIIGVLAWKSSVGQRRVIQPRWDARCDRQCGFTPRFRPIDSVARHKRLAGDGVRAGQSSSSDGRCRDRAALGREQWARTRHAAGTARCAK